MENTTQEVSGILFSSTQAVLTNRTLKAQIIETKILPSLNPKNVITLLTYIAIENALLCYVMPVLFLVGVPANVLNMAVFWRQGLKDRMNLCLFSLAFVDMMFVATISSCLVLPCFVADPGLVDKVRNLLKVGLTGVYRGFLFSSGSLTMIIAVERCLCVFMPMKAATLFSTKTMLALVLTVVLALQVLCVQYPLKLAVAQDVDRATNATTYFLATTPLYGRYTQLFDVLENTVTMVVIPFTNFLVVFVSTALTVVQLKRAAAWRKVTTSGSGSSAQKERRLVMMLVIVDCLFIACACPNIALGLARTLVYEFWHTRSQANIFLATHLIYLTLGAFHSCLNFFVYFSRSSRFARELRGLFCVKKLLEWGTTHTATSAEHLKSDIS